MRNEDSLDIQDVLTERKPKNPTPVIGTLPMLRSDAANAGNGLHHMCNYVCECV